MVSKSYRVAIGACAILFLLVLASAGVEATTVYVGNLAVTETYKGGGGPNSWTKDQLFNGSAYGGPYQNFWSAGSTLNFNISMKVINTCGFTTDFRWVVKVNQEGNKNYDIYIESDPPVHNQDATHWVYGVLNNGDVTITGHIIVVPQYYWDNIDIITQITPYRNSAQVGPSDNAQWSWAGTP